VAVGLLEYSKLFYARLQAIHEVLMVDRSSHTLNYRLFHYFCYASLGVQSFGLRVMGCKRAQHPCSPWSYRALSNFNCHLLRSKYRCDSKILSWDSSLVEKSWATESGGKVPQIWWLLHYSAWNNRKQFRPRRFPRIISWRQWRREICCCKYYRIRIAHNLVWSHLQDLALEVVSWGQ